MGEPICIVFKKRRYISLPLVHKSEAIEDFTGVSSTGIVFKDETVAMVKLNDVQKKFIEGT